MKMILTRVRSLGRTLRRESGYGAGYAAAWFFRRFYYRFVRPRVVRPDEPEAADFGRGLTVLVPAAEKDSDLLRLCLAGVREHLSRQNHEVWVVAPESEVLRKVCEEAGVKHVLEDTVLPVPARELKTRGWVVQQLIKMNACRHVPTEDYLVLDADTVFLRKQVFFRGGRTVLRYADQYELLYERSLTMILGDRPRFPVSFVTHHMVMNRGIVESLLRQTGERLGAEWWDGLVRVIDANSISPISFSEFDLYGNYVMNDPELRGRHVLEYWHGVDAPNRVPGELLGGGLGSKGDLNSVSFHRHTQ